MSTTKPQNSSSLGNARAAQAAELATFERPKRGATPVRTARARIAPEKKRRARPVPLGPTPERQAKGDLAVGAATNLGRIYRAVPPVERLAEQGKLDKAARTNEGMLLAAQKLKRHFDSCMIGVKAQDLDRVIGGNSDGLTGEEAWVYHYDTFCSACRLMGWSETNPHRGAGRIVVAVVCYEMAVRDAALAHVGAGRLDAIQAAGMDRLREGLFMLAGLWRMC